MLQLDCARKENLVNEVYTIIADTEPSEYHEILDELEYKRPWRPARTGWTNLFDQFLHMVYAVIVLVPLFAWPGYWSAALSGFLLGLLREIEQYRKQDYHILMFWDRFMDIAFFVAGAIVMYHFLK